jgi:hypothetical protein
MVSRTAKAGESHPSTRVSSILNIRGGPDLRERGMRGSLSNRNEQNVSSSRACTGSRLMACSPSGVLRWGSGRYARLRASWGLNPGGLGSCGRTDPTTQAVNPEARPGQLAAIGRVTRGEPHPNQHLPVLRSRIRSFCATSLDAARDRRQKELTVGRERAITARLALGVGMRLRRGRSQRAFRELRGSGRYCR